MGSLLTCIWLWAQTLHTCEWKSHYINVGLILRLWRKKIVHKPEKPRKQRQCPSSSLQTPCSLHPWSQDFPPRTSGTGKEEVCAWHWLSQQPTSAFQLAFWNTTAPWFIRWHAARWWSSAASPMRFKSAASLRFCKDSRVDEKGTKMMWSMRPQTTAPKPIACHPPPVGPLHVALSLLHIIHLNTKFEPQIPLMCS